MAEIDPFTQATAAVWQMLLENADFAEMVPIGNCIRYCDVTVNGTTYEASREPLKPSRQPADYIEVDIRVSDGDLKEFASSSATLIQKVYEIRCRTSDKRLRWVDGAGKVHGMFPLQWAIVRIMANWFAYLEPLTWNGEQFVHHCELNKSDENLDIPHEHREENVKHSRAAGWVTLWRGVVNMNFTSANLPYAS